MTASGIDGVKTCDAAERAGDADAGRSSFARNDRESTTADGDVPRLDFANLHQCTDAGIPSQDCHLLPFFERFDDCFRPERLLYKFNGHHRIGTERGFFRCWQTLMAMVPENCQRNSMRLFTMICNEISGSRFEQRVWTGNRVGCFSPFLGRGAQILGSDRIGRYIRCDVKKNPRFSGRRNGQIRETVA